MEEAQYPFLAGERSVYLVNSQAAITFTNSTEYFQKPDAEPYVLEDDIKVVPWGDSNDFPNVIVPLVSKNPVSSAAIDTAIDILYGGSVKFGYKNEKDEFVAYTTKEINVSEQLSEIQQFWEDNNVDEMLGDICSDLRWFAQAPIELITDKKTTGRKIVQIAAKEMFFTRWSSQNKEGKIEKHLYSAKWDQRPKKDEYTVTDTLDFERPDIDFISRLEKKIYRYIYPIRLPSPGRQYYPRAYWHSIIESGWLDFANDIPTYKKALAKHMLSVAYHLQINGDYFARVFAAEGITDAVKQRERMKKEYTEIDAFLTGAENAGKSLRSFYFMKPGKNGTMQEVQDIKITVIERKVGGEYLEDSQEASSMIYTGFRVHPSLVGVIPGKTQSNMSGTDKRELLRIAQIMQNRTRNRILKLFYLIKKINNWPKEVQFAFVDLMLTTLDTGSDTQKTVNS